MHNKVRWYVASHFQVESLEKTHLQEALAREVAVAKIKSQASRHSDLRKRS